MKVYLDLKDPHYGFQEIQLKDHSYEGLPRPEGGEVLTMGLKDQCYEGLPTPDGA